MQSVWAFFNVCKMTVSSTILRLRTWACQFAALISDLESSWTAWWPPTRAISAVAELFVFNCNKQFAK